MRQSKHHKCRRTNVDYFLLLVCLSCFITSQLHATNVSGTISSNTTWTMAGSPYVIISDAAVDNGVTLTIQPGVEVIIPQYYIQLSIRGVLSANGTPANPILFNGPTSADYGGTLVISPTGIANLSYVKFSKLGDGASSQDASMYVQGGGVATIDNCDFENSEFHGLHLLKDAVVTVSNCLFQNNGWHDVLAHPNAVGGFENNNTLGEIRFISATIDNNCVWPLYGLNTNYRFSNDVTIALGSTLTIHPGATVVIPFYYMELYVAGQLNAIGSSSLPIIFTGPASPDFGGDVVIQTSGLANMQYCQFNRLAAAVSGIAAGLYVNGGGTANLQNCDFEDNEQFGLQLLEDANVSATDCNFLNNGLYHVLAHPNAVGGFNDNNLDVIHIQSATINNDCTWPDASESVRYHLLHNVTVAAGQTLTIDPGVEIYFPNYFINLIAHGKLIANGTSTSSILFQGPDAGTGNHGGSLYLSSTSTGSEIQFATFTRLGDFSSSYDAGLRLRTSDVLVSNCLFEDNQDAGIFISDNASPEILNSTLRNNNHGLLANSGSTNISNSNIYNNTVGVKNTGSDTVDARNNYWGDASGPYHVILNPPGMGNSVSDRVLFEPWIDMLIHPPIPCLDVNLSFASGTTIASGHYAAENTVDAASHIISPSEVILSAGVSIELLPDFEIALGAELLAQIQDCVVDN